MQTAAINYKPLIQKVNLPLDSITFNYNEVQLLKIAITFLFEQLNISSRQPYFTDLLLDQVTVLSNWLDNDQLLQTLRFDSTNKATWIINPFVDLNWLRLALEVFNKDLDCLEDTLTTMAYDDANYDYDMMTYADDPYYRGNTCNKEGSGWSSNWQGYFNYYCQFLSVRKPLLTKLRLY